RSGCGGRRSSLRSARARNPWGTRSRGTRCTRSSPRISASSSSTSGRYGAISGRCAYWRRWSYWFPTSRFDPCPARWWVSCEQRDRRLRSGQILSTLREAVASTLRVGSGRTPRVARGLLGVARADVLGGVWGVGGNYRPKRGREEHAAQDFDWYDPADRGPCTYRGPRRGLARARERLPPGLQRPAERDDGRATDGAPGAGDRRPDARNRGIC